MLARAVSRTARLLLAVIVVTSMVAVVVPGAGAVATTYYVDPVGGLDTNDGKTEGAAFKTIWRSLESPGAVSGDTVVCLPGTYSDSSNGEKFPLHHDPGVMIVSKMGPDVTIIDGEDTGTSNMFEMWNPIENTGIEGFTFRNFHDGTSDYIIEVNRYEDGTYDGWPLIKDNVFESGETMRASVIELWGSNDTQWIHPRIIGNEFKDIGEVGEQMPDEGSCISVGDFVDAHIEGNSFHDVVVDGGGAGVYFTGGPHEAMIVDNEFVDLTSESDAAAIEIDGSGTSEPINVVIEGNYFSGCDAISGDGGAMQIYGSSDVAITGNAITECSAAQDGGAIYSWDSTLTVENNYIYSNEVTTGAGAAMYVNDCGVTFNNNTVYGNLATGGGFNGIHKEGTYDFNIVNSIFWGHSSEDVEGTRIRRSCTEDTDLLTTGTGNDIGTNDNRNIHDNPMFFDAASGDFRLKLGSPCVDAMYGDGAVGVDEDINGWPRPQDGDGDGTAEIDLGAWEKPTVEVARVAGADRYATAADVAMDAFDGEADTAVIASGQNFPDALSAAGLCGSYEAPLLLTRTASLPAATAQALSDMGVTDVFIVGGTGAVSSAVENVLKASYNVTRIAGANRYDTSALVAREVEDHDGADFSKRAFFARGDSFPDALAVSPYSYSDISPILLVRPTALPSVIGIAMNDLGIDDGAVCGGTGAVSDTAKAAIDVILVANGGSASERWGGADRYATAVKVASEATDAGYGSYAYTGIATGSNFPDALAGGVGAGAAGGAVLLTRTSSLPSATAAELTKQKAQVIWCEVMGGEGAVTSSVKTAIETALGW